MDYIFFIILVVAIIIGILLTILSGVIRVKKNDVAIIEKMHEFDTILCEGIHFITPILSHRVKTYHIEHTKIKGQFGNYKISIIFKIEDYKKYYYSNEIFENNISLKLKSIKTISKDAIEKTIYDYASEIGILVEKLELIDIQVID